MEKRFDLEERTARFGEDLIKLCKTIKEGTVITPIIAQLIRCSTSVGANYCEADDAESRRDFKHKIGICKKESHECKHFLRMLTTALPELKLYIDTLQKEARELNLIFNSIYKKL